MVSRRQMLAALGILPAAGMLRGQQQTPQNAPAKDAPTFSSGVKVVNLYANVRDKKGDIVKDLTKDDFLLDEEGVRQTIRYFSQESNLPLTLGLLVDTSGSQRRLIEEERSASYQFFEQVLREDKDVAFVIHFDFEVELLQDLTSSRKLLDEALQLLDAPQQLRRNRQSGQYPGGGYPGGGYPGGRGGYPGGGGGGRRGGGGTDLYDAVMLASDELLKKQTGRKAIILLTDGVDTGSKVPLSTAIEAAQRADTIVYGILFEDSEMYGGGAGVLMGGMGRGGRGGRGGGPMIGGPNGKKVLDQISRETGGRMFQVSKKLPLSKVYEQIEQDLRNQYSLGFTPESAGNGAFRRIHLTTKQKGLIVQTREGYYSS